MFKEKSKNGVDIVGQRYVPACTTIGSGNIFVGKAKNVFTKEEAQTISGVIAEGSTEYEGNPLVSTQPFGEVISLVSEATNAAKVTVVGEDYLGQTMVEEITLNSATAVSGKKAFKTIKRFFMESASTKAVSMKTTGVVGLQFFSVSLDYAVKNGAKDSTAAVTVGTYTQTATSADTRGTVSLAHAATGDTCEIVYNTSDYVDGSGKGGLFGVPHYAG